MDSAILDLCFAIHIHKVDVGLLKTCVYAAAAATAQQKAAAAGEPLQTPLLRHQRANIFVCCATGMIAFFTLLTNVQLLQLVSSFPW